MEDKRI